MLTMCRHSVKCYICIISFNLHNTLNIGIIKPILLMRKLRLREVKLTCSVRQLLSGRGRIANSQPRSV